MAGGHLVRLHEDNIHQIDKYNLEKENPDDSIRFVFKAKNLCNSQYYRRSIVPGSRVQYFWRFTGTQLDLVCIFGAFYHCWGLGIVPIMPGWIGMPAKPCAPATEQSALAVFGSCL